MKWIEPWAQGLLDRYIETRDILHLYALGAIAGITGEPFADREPDWREPNAALASVEKYFRLKK
jgi:hypothetical protein